MSPKTLEQELNLSRRACCHRSAAYSSVTGGQVSPGRSKCYRSCFSLSVGASDGLLLVLLGVLLCSFPAPSCGRPNGTAAGLLGSVAHESQPNVSIIV